MYSTGVHNHVQNHFDGALAVVCAPSPYPSFNSSGSNHHAHQHPQHQDIHHVLAGQSGHAPAMDYCIRSPTSAGPVPGGGPLSGLCNDGVRPSPHDGSMQNMASHLRHPQSPRRHSDLLNIQSDELYNLSSSDFFFSCFLCVCREKWLKLGCGIFGVDIKGFPIDGIYLSCRSF